MVLFYCHTMFKCNEFLSILTNKRFKLQYMVNCNLNAVHNWSLHSGLTVNHNLMTSYVHGKFDVVEVIYVCIAFIILLNFIYLYAQSFIYAHDAMPRYLLFINMDVCIDCIYRIVFIYQYCIYLSILYLSIVKNVNKPSQARV